MLHLSTLFCEDVDPETLKDEFEDLQLFEDDAVVTPSSTTGPCLGPHHGLEDADGVSSVSCPDHCLHSTALPAAQQRRFRKNILYVEKAEHRV